MGYAGRYTFGLCLPPTAPKWTRWAMIPAGRTTRIYKEKPRRRLGHQGPALSAVEGGQKSCRLAPPST